MLNWTTLVILIAMLYVGGILGVAIVDLIPYDLSGYVHGFIIAMIQLTLVGFIGLMAKMSLTTIAIGAVIIVVAGILGGFLIDMIGISGIVASILIMAIQSVALIATGIVKGKASPNISLKA